VEAERLYINVAWNLYNAINWEALQGRVLSSPYIWFPKIENPWSLLLIYKRGLFKFMRNFQDQKRLIITGNYMHSTMKDDTDLILNQGLMFQCLNWGDSGCHPEIIEFFDFKKIKGPKDETRRLPNLDEIKKFNEICKQCPKAYLEIHKKECPACGSNNIVAGFAPRLGDNNFKTPHILHPYYCVACGKYLFSGIGL
jgi:hypothetical protein